MSALVDFQHFNSDNKASWLVGKSGILEYGIGNQQKKKKVADVFSIKAIATVTSYLFPENTFNLM